MTRASEGRESDSAMNLDEKVVVGNRPEALVRSMSRIWTRTARLLLRIARRSSRGGPNGGWDEVFWQQIGRFGAVSGIEIAIKNSNSGWAYARPTVHGMSAQQSNGLGRLETIQCSLMSTLVFRRPAVSEQNRRVRFTHPFSSLLFKKCYSKRMFVILLLAFFLFVASVQADSEVSFIDIAQQPSAGLEYERTESESTAIAETLYQEPVIFITDLPEFPNKWRGAPGVALLDYDNDGDIDIYVTNGPGSDNSLFASQQQQSGVTTFIDLAVSAGVAANDQDSSGTCFGDTDNDGDADLFVLSNFGSNRFFENGGDGTFTDISAGNGLSVGETSSLSCSFGDIDGDGLLDVVVANTWNDMSNGRALGLNAFSDNQHNQLYRNLGGNQFVDVSASSGILDLRGYTPGENLDGLPSITWGIAMVDYDQDGDADIVHADDQGVIPFARYQGLDRGFIHILENDGGGQFTDVTVERGTNKPGQWMGLAFGDLNDDGHLDIFGGNFGDFATLPFSPLNPIYGAISPYELGDSSSRWFLGSASGAFSDPGVGDLVGTPFGWGVSMLDYDNDADTDVIYHGGHVTVFINIADNFGVLLENDGNANFDYDLQALANSTDHTRRIVHGVAVGDLNDDGFADIVSVSNADVQPAIPLIEHAPVFSTPVDDLAVYQVNLETTDKAFEYTTKSQPTNVNGSLSVEINGGNNNRWAKVKLLGGKGITSQGVVNRDGIGAVVGFRNWYGDATLRPVIGGASYASQDSLELVFGMDRARKGQIDVLWPGGVKNRLYGVRHRERIEFPEIPCSIDGNWSSFGAYVGCVGTALGELWAAGEINYWQKLRFFSSAVLAYFVEH